MIDAILSHTFNGFEPWALLIAGMCLAYGFRLIPTIRITVTKEEQDD